MKKTLLALALIVLMCNGYAQDIITKKNGEDIKAKVIEITTTEVKYKKYEFQDGPLYSLSKSDIIMVRYENGSKDLMSTDNTTKQEEKPTEQKNDNNIDISEQAIQDANANYSGKGSGAGGTAIITFLTTPVIGLIPAIAISSSEPSEDNLKYPDSKLMKKSEYSNAYRHQAHKIKKKKVWSAYGVGCGIWLFIILALSGAGA